MLARIRKYFLSGMIVSLPIVVTIYLLVSVVKFADGLLGQYLEPYFYEKFGFYFHGLSIILAIYIVILIGFLATNIVGKKIHEFFEKVILKLPFFKQVYPALKEMVLFFFARDQLTKTYEKVVLVEYPRKGVYSFGFLTSDSSDYLNSLTKKEMCNVFISSSPSPLTGFTVLVPKKDIILTDLSVEYAFKFILSGGVVNPQDVTRFESKKK